MSQKPVFFQIKGWADRDRTIASKRDILTICAMYLHGIKAWLISGEVGRVKEIY